MSAAAAEEPAVSGALHLPHPLQHIPAPREERLLAALLYSLDGTGTRSLPHCGCRLLLYCINLLPFFSIYEFQPVIFGTLYANKDRIIR